MYESILAIDDDRDLLDLLQDLLNEEGYFVQTSMSATWPMLLQHLEHVLPDLILLDVRLGEKDGRIMCRQLKANTLTRHIPVILLSAYVNKHEAIGDSFADDFLAKPFSIITLLETLSKHLR